jgi:hypothetical protein
MPDCWVCKGRYLKRLKIHAKGRHGIMHHTYFHLTVVLREVPYSAGERRLGILSFFLMLIVIVTHIILGRFGRSNKAIRKQLGLAEEDDDSKTVDGASKNSTGPTKSAGLLEK